MCWPEELTTDNIVQAERSNYYDLGVEQVLSKAFMVGVAITSSRAVSSTRVSSVPRTGVPKSWWMAQARQRQIPFRKFGRRVRFDPKEVLIAPAFRARKPLKTDSAGKCTRWWVIHYNPIKHKQEWITVRGSLKDAEEIERKALEKLGRGTFIARTERMTLSAVVTAFLQECKARNRRTSTMLNYQSVFNNYVLERFGFREVGTLQK